MRIAPLTLFLALALPAQPVMADSEQQRSYNYLGANAGLFFVEEDQVNNNSVPDWKSVHAGVKLGHNYNRFFAIEGHLSIADGDTNDIAGTPATLDKQYGLGLYLRGNYWLNNNRTNLYALAGVSHSRIDTTLPGSSLDRTTNDLSGGFGLDHYLLDDTAINIEWIQIIHRDNIEAQTLGFGIMRRFD